MQHEIRNIICHGYDIVDSEIVWDAIQFNLPKLKADVLACKKKYQ